MRPAWFGIRLGIPQSSRYILENPESILPWKLSAAGRTPREQCPLHTLLLHLQRFTCGQGLQFLTDCRLGWTESPYKLEHHCFSLSPTVRLGARRRALTGSSTRVQLSGCCVQQYVQWFTSFIHNMYIIVAINF